MNRLRARREDCWTRAVQLADDGAETIAAWLSDPANESIMLDWDEGQSRRASTEIQTGAAHGSPGLATRYMAQIVLPVADGEVDAVVASVCDLAAVLQVAAGFIAIGRKHGLAQDLALGGRLSLRSGASPQRFRERWGRARYAQHITTQVAGVEWGTFLGPGHLARTDFEQIRRSRVFARTRRINAELAYLQVTTDPADDLAEGIEPKLIAARQALGTLLMDVSIFAPAPLEGASARGRVDAGRR